MHVVMHMHVVVVMAPMPAMVMVHGHRCRRPGRVGDRLHGRLSSRRSSHKRCDGERRYGKGWKFHGLFP
jgi:hypothetical protein